MQTGIAASLEAQINQRLDLTSLGITTKINKSPVQIVQIWDEHPLECGVGECEAPLPFSYEPGVQFFRSLTSHHSVVVLDNNQPDEEVFGLYHISTAPTYVRPPEYVTLFPSSDEQGEGFNVAPLPSLGSPHCVPV